MHRVWQPVEVLNKARVTLQPASKTQTLWFPKEDATSQTKHSSCLPINPPRQVLCTLSFSCCFHRQSLDRAVRTILARKPRVEGPVLVTISGCCPYANAMLPSHD